MTLLIVIASQNPHQKIDQTKLIPHKANDEIPNSTCKLKPNKQILEFFLKNSNSSGAIFIDTSAGFPSPADDFKETRISLDEELIVNKEETFFARVSGQSMIGAGLDDNDLLVIDRS